MVAAIGSQSGRAPSTAALSGTSAEIYRDLAEKNPEIYLRDVAMTLSNLAVFDREQNRTDAARKEFEEALGIYERFAERNPERFQSDVARVKRQLQTLGK